jgi:MFS transporter, ACS family, pantothenate transporter
MRRYVLPACEIAWGLITIGTYKVTSSKQLYVLRFFLGLLEGTSFVGIQYVLGSWYATRSQQDFMTIRANRIDLRRYKQTELGKRTAIFANSAYVGTAFGGYIFSGVRASMNGYRGVTAWRWAFVVDGIITIVIGIYGLIFFPDTPEKTTAFYLSTEERRRCVDRLKEEDRQPVGSFSWDIFKRVLTSWQFYILSVLWCFW